MFITPKYNNFDAAKYFNLNRPFFNFNNTYYIILQNKIKKLTKVLVVLQQYSNIYTEFTRVSRLKKLDLTLSLKYGISVNLLLIKYKLKLKFLKFCLINLMDDVPNKLDDRYYENLNIVNIVKVVPISRKFNFKPKEHFLLFNRYLNVITQETALKISGTRFSMFHGFLAKLYRALGQFMLDTHTQKNNYIEVNVPFLVKEDSLYNTGQLPKFKEELYKIQKEDLWLIPTGEVPLVNIVSGLMLSEDDLPLKFVSKTACFRREVGKYGKDLKGIFRQHQFEKVELIQIVTPEMSEYFLQSMLRDVTSILDYLELPYRVILLNKDDIGFTSSITYDVEVWLPGKGDYIEVSSCSNTTDFQSRRMGTLYKNKITGKNEFVHTLNGSGLALGRVLIGIMENYQDIKGCIDVPSVLQPYMG
jgi:seryl-tRNA synthetase